MNKTRTSTPTAPSRETGSARESRSPKRPTVNAGRSAFARRVRRAWREGFATALAVALVVGLWNSPLPKAHADDAAAPAQEASTTATDAATTTTVSKSTDVAAKPAADKAETPKTPAPVEPTVPEAAKVEVPAETPRTLSVEPTPERRPFAYDKTKRPAWVDQGMQHSGESQFTVVTSGPRVTDREAQRGLDEEIVKAVRDYVGEYLDSPTAAEVLPLSLRDIKARMRSDQFYVELVEFDIGPMYIAYALVEFNPEFRTDLEQRWQNLVSYGRVATFGVGIGAIFLVLGSLLTFLRVDTATRGYYTRRLQLATVTTILAIVTAGVVLARHFFLI